MDEAVPDGITILSMEEGARRRPGMYVGGNDGKGIIGLISGLFKECADLCNTDEFLFSASVLGNNKFSIALNSEKNIAPFIQNIIFYQNGAFPYLHTKLIVIFSETLKITSHSNYCHFSKGQLQANNFPEGNERLSAVELTFEIDKTIFKDTHVDFIRLCEKLFMLSLVARKSQILVKDTRKKYLCQDYYHFPEGIFYIYDRIKGDVLGTPKIEMKYDNQIIDNHCQIVIAYRTDWYPEPSITCLVNDRMEEGSIAGAIIKGVTGACRKYIEIKNLSSYKIKRKKILNGLIIVCSIRGKNFHFATANDIIESKELMSAIKKIAETLFFGCLEKSTSVSEDFLTRFGGIKLGDITITLP